MWVGKGIPEVGVGEELWLGAGRERGGPFLLFFFLVTVFCSMLFYYFIILCHNPHSTAQNQNPESTANTSHLIHFYFYFLFFDIKFVLVFDI